MNLNRDLTNIVKSYLLISEKQIDRNKKLITSHLNHLDLSDKFVLYDYCVSCDKIGSYRPLFCSEKYLIIFNGKTICDKCYKFYEMKKEVLRNLIYFFWKNKKIII